MSVRRFKFVSPGVFINEIDDSKLPKQAPVVGPVVIGRTQRGPAFRPTQVDSFSDFIQVFGEPVPGAGAGSSDVWRSGVPLAATYASYAAQAYLRNNGPVTVVRTLGSVSPEADTSTLGMGGWLVGNASTHAVGAGSTTEGGAFGLFLFNSGTAGNTPGVTSVTGTLAAVWYCSQGCVALSGNLRGEDTAANQGISGTSVLIESAAGGEFKALVKDSSNNILQQASFNFDADSDKYIRKVFNTNPTLTNTSITATDAQEKYFLGQSYDRAAIDKIGEEQDGGTIGVILGLGDGTNGGNDFRIGNRAAQTGWVISQDLRTTAGNKTNSSANAISFDPESSNVTKLFKLHGLSEGEWEQRNLKVSIEKIKVSPNNSTKYGSFSVVLRDIRDNDKNVVVVERFDGLNLNPNSPDFIAKRIGDMYVSFDDTRKRLVEYGTYPNMSSFVRVEMSNVIETGGGDAELLPFGFHGPIVHNSFTLDTSGNKATATLRIVSTTAASYDGGTFTLTDTAGTAKTYVFDDDGGGATGTLDGSNVRIQIQGLTNRALISEQVENAIESANGHAGTITVVRSTHTHTNDLCTLTQGTGGAGGNNTISRAVITSDGVYTISGFTGGVDEAADIPYATITGNTFARGGHHIMNNEETSTAGVANAVVLGSITNVDLTSGSALHAQVDFPSHRLRADDSAGGLSDPLSAYWGIDTTRSGSQNLSFDASNIDLAHALPKDVAESFAPGNKQTTSFVFTLANLSGTSDNSSNAADGQYTKISYVSGSRADGRSITAASGSYRSILSVYNEVGGAKFTMPLCGGFDGLNITEREPFNASRALLSSVTEASSSPYYSIKKAVDIVADPEFAEMNLAAMPGITNENLTKHLIDTCESRGDALAIIDPRGGYTPNSEDATSESTRISSTAAKDVADNMKARNINSSYGAAYFPWVQIRDSGRGHLLFVPPSVVALGVLGSSEARSAVWFAPAGFTRGGLTEGASGLNVVGVRTKLTSDERDRLYEANIIPIASFPSEGIVIFGQKTLQVTQSAVDRINVRRMLIFVKKEISRISATTLFTQNVQSTWDRFKGRCDTFLTNVKIGLGLSDFRIVLDDTTTTPDLVDRNIMYAKIFLKPARAIEFIALDFVITNTGASFED